MAPDSETGSPVTPSMRYENIVSQYFRDDSPDLQSPMRWATREEIMEHLTEAGEAERGGPTVLLDGDREYTDSSEAHWMVIGSTGAGKS